MRGSIIWNNNPAAPFYYQSDGTIDITYSNIESGWSGTGNIDTDPIFVDPANDDYICNEWNDDFTNCNENNEGKEDNEIYDIGEPYLDFGIEPNQQE